MKKHTINEIGIKQIAQQLKSACKPSEFMGWLDNDLIDSQETKKMLSAWAEQLETALDSGDGDEIEISHHITNSGHTEWIYVTDEGINIESADVEAQSDQKPYYMNIFTGSVALKSDWTYQNQTGVWVNAVDLGEVSEVKKDDLGEWVEA
tara:strand:+ start:99 stop:548 length:450 start_codon:yes stop_codon:yes gene_type:complete